MKIICVDNFNRETESDELIAENINKYWGKEIVDFLNDKYSGDTAGLWFRLVEDNHKLYEFEP